MVANANRSVAIVTGANRVNGIGLAIVREFLGAGLTCVATYRELDRASSLLALQQQNPKLRAAQLDVTSEQSVSDFARECERHLDGVDIIVNNAGIGSSSGPVESAPIAELELQAQTHAIAVVRITQALLPLLRPNSVVINVSSALGSMRSIGGGHTFYAPAKAFQNALTLQLASRLLQRDIIVLALHPGWAATAIGGPAAPVDPRTSAKGIAAIARNASAIDAGTFQDYAGRRIAW